MGPGPVVQHVGGRDGSWLSLFPFSFWGAGTFPLFFLLLVSVGHYDRQGRSTRMFLWEKRRKKRGATAFSGAAVIARLGCI